MTFTANHVVALLAIICAVYCAYNAVKSARDLDHLGLWLVVFIIYCIIIFSRISNILQG